MITAKSHNNAINSLLVKYQFGYYWLFPLADNLDKTYFRVMLNDFHILLPDNVINIGRIEFLVQRYNIGFYEDKGTRNVMEDIISIRQELNVSHQINFSFFAVFDG